jgi:DNA-binding GntR family transcriptional regulator
MMRSSASAAAGILSACAARDADKAQAALDAHFQAAVQRNLGLL